jgi:hypothetical protein
MKRFNSNFISPHQASEQWLLHIFLGREAHISFILPAASCICNGGRGAEELIDLAAT